MNDPIILIFQLIVLLFSVIIHEISHGYAAYMLGDTTAKDSGRLTLNPLKHIDPFGSIILPLTLFIIQSPVMFGWAKPVPFDPRNLKNPKRDSGFIGLAGPASNYSIAIIFAIILKLAIILGLSAGGALVIFINIIILVNVVLATFNLVPLPPLDGSKILFAILPRGTEKFQMLLERYGFFILLFFIFFGFQLLVPLILSIYHLLGGNLL